MTNTTIGAFKLMASCLLCRKPLYLGGACLQNVENTFHAIFMPIIRKERWATVFSLAEGIHCKDVCTESVIKLNI